MIMPADVAADGAYDGGVMCYGTRIRAHLDVAADPGRGSRKGTSALVDVFFSLFCEFPREEFFFDGAVAVLQVCVFNGGVLLPRLYSLRLTPPR